jgi:glycosyltransferase involved in cell wall biosynthesis
MRRRITVIVPTFDRPVLLRQALQSIRDVEAAGDDLEIELIIGDNGHKPATKEICAEFGAIHVLAEGKGASVGRNAALTQATGEFVAFLDDDDVWLRENMRPQLAFLDAHPEFDAAFGQGIYADPELKPYGPPWPETSPGEGNALVRRMLGGLFPQIGTVLIRRAAFARYGLFDSVIEGGEDWDFQLRIARAHKHGFVATPCMLVRVRPVGSYDALQQNRIKTARHIFLRHALRSLRVWRSPWDFVRGYHDVLQHFYSYFIENARRSVRQTHRRAEALKMMGVLAVNVPLLFMADLVRPSELRVLASEVVRGNADEPKK